ncbi:MAG: peptidase E, partial [Halobacteriovoraceae bacterium]|nr:peptidase E [Halobacteriovoraceae bacterium]
MKLIMTGGGDSLHFEEIDQFFINLLDKDANLLFIPLAGDPDSWEDGLSRIKQTFSTIQFSKIEMCLDLSKLRWKKLKKFDAIYIDGGNTFDLMEEIHHTHFYELLHRFLHHGGVVNGDSAGAIILG